MDSDTRTWVLLISATTAAAVTIGLLRVGPVWDSLASRQMGTLTDRFSRLSLGDEKLRLSLRLWGVGLAVCVAGLWYGAGMPPLAILAGFIVYIAPRYILDHLIRQRSRLLRDQLVGSAIALANSVRAGLSIAQGLETACDDAPQPIKSELHRIVFEYKRGRPLKEAIEATRSKLALEEFTLFALALEVALERGGRLNEALERICCSLREKASLERKLAACTAAGRQTVIFLSAAPVGFVVMFSLFDSEYSRVMFETLTGQFMLAVTCLLVYFGGSWAWRIVNFEF
jgi:tight adherence protein B